MAKNKGVNIPSGFGGLTRFGDEYESKFNLKPSHVVVFILIIIAFRVFLGIFYG
jgi:preprotein translocase subunit Sec61beta